MDSGSVNSTLALPDWLKLYFRLVADWSALSSLAVDWSALRSFPSADWSVRRSLAVDWSAPLPTAVDWSVPLRLAVADWLPGGEPDSGEPCCS